MEKKQEITMRFTEQLEDYFFEFEAKIDGSGRAELFIRQNDDGKPGKALIALDLTWNDIENLAYLFDHAPREIKKLKDLA